MIVSPSFCDGAWRKENNKEEDGWETSGGFKAPEEDPQEVFITNAWGDNNLH